MKIFSTITLALSTKRPKLIQNIHIKITLIPSQKKTLIPFLSHQQTNNKFNWFTSLDIIKATGPYSVPTKMLKLHKKDISD